MKELWKGIKGYEGVYQVSNFGRVKSLSRVVQRKGRSRSFKVKSKILSMNKLNKSGYRVCILSRNDVKDYRRFNRLVAEAFIPNPENKPFVNHIDGNKLNNNVNNLEWCTNKENINHAFDIGLIKRGEDHPLAKLTRQDVREIFRLAKNKIYKQKEVAVMYNVAPSLVSRIVSGNERGGDTEDLRDELQK